MHHDYCIIKKFIYQIENPEVKENPTEKKTCAAEKKRKVSKTAQDRGQTSFTRKKIQKVLRKIEEMEDVFLNSANFATHTFLTLAPPSRYALNLKALIKVSKVS